MDTLRPFVEELKQRASIVDIIGRVVPLKPKGKGWWGCCPFHNEKTPSFSVNEEMGIFKCFGCGEGGDVITFLMKKNNMGYVDAVRELAGIVGVQMPAWKPKDPEEEKRESDYFGLLLRAQALYAERLGGSPAEEYIARRGITPDVAKKYGLGYAPTDNIISKRAGAAAIPTGLVRNGRDGESIYDFFRGRLMFPISNARGEVIAFSGRSLDGSEPKYINIQETEFFQKRRTLFGLNFALPEIRNRRRAIVVEGQIDAIQMQTHGFGETVAPLGTAITTEHVEILLKYAKELVFCFDGDAAGQKAAERAAGLVMPMFKSETNPRFAFMTGGKDPDELLRTGAAGLDAMKKIIDGAMPLSDFVWKIANRNFAVMTENGRASADKWLRAEYGKIPDLKLKDEMLATLKNREWEEWNKYRRTIRPEMAAPDPGGLAGKTIAEIKQKFPDLFEENFELLGGVKIPASAPDTKMTRIDAVKKIKEFELNRQIQNLEAEGASSDQIQKLKDMILDLWN